MTLAGHGWMLVQNIRIFFRRFLSGLFDGLVIEDPRHELDDVVESLFAATGIRWAKKDWPGEAEEAVGRGSYSSGKKIFFPELYDPRRSAMKTPSQGAQHLWTTPRRLPKERFSTFCKTRASGRHPRGGRPRVRWSTALGGRSWGKIAVCSPRCSRCRCRKRNSPGGQCQMGRTQG